MGNAGDTIRNRDAAQARATVKRLTADSFDAVADRDLGQVVAVVEAIGVDIGDAVGDCDTHQGLRPSERMIPHAGDRQEIDRAGDGHRTTWAGITRDGDRAVNVRVGKILGLHFSNHQP